MVTDLDKKIVNAVRHTKKISPAHWETDLTFLSN